MKAIIITGQTATGKSQLALKYAKKYNGELINCDSRQIYKYLDIITGKDLGQNSKPPFKIQKKINDFTIGFYPLLIDSSSFSSISTKLWLCDIVDPKQAFSSFDWKQCSQIVMAYLKKQAKTPIIVGGTYLYIKHLLYGVETENIPPDWQLRKKLAKKSVDQLQKILKNLSEKLFNQLNQSDKNNPHRLIRKIEIASHLKLANLSDLANLNNFDQNQWQIIGLKFADKQSLSEAIKKRVKERLKNGAIEEVENLLKKGYTENDPGLKTIGYQQIIAYLKKRLTKEETINQWITKEIQYAKRQYTFMKKDKNIKWYSL